MKTPTTLVPTGTRCTVQVPASTANLGPGFDCIGCAVALQNIFEFTVLADGAEDTVAIGGSRRDGIPTTPDNLALATARDFFRRQGAPAPALGLRATVEIPNARGLGSSSTAIVAGLAGANGLLDTPLSLTELLNLAVEIEGHPDNVAPALLGGLVVSAAHSHPLAWRQVAIHDNICFIFVVPDYEVKTADARGVLPGTVPFADAIYNSSRSPLVLLSLQSGNLTGLRQVIDDRLHQPYRKHLFRGYDVLCAAAYDGGAAGFCVSGAGPTMLAITERDHRDSTIRALQAGLAQAGLTGTVREICPDNIGTRVAVHRPD